MKNARRHAAMIFAKAGISDKEIVRLLLDIRRVHPEDFIEEVEACRAKLRSVGSSNPRNASRPDKEWTLGERVETLLKKEARLSTANAHIALTNALVDALLVRPDELPPLSKKSFSSWVDRVAAIVPHKELLRLATMIRNRHVGGDPIDWLGSEALK